MNDVLGALIGGAIEAQQDGFEEGQLRARKRGHVESPRGTAAVIGVAVADREDSSYSPEASVRSVWKTIVSPVRRVSSKLATLTLCCQDFSTGSAPPSGSTEAVTPYSASHRPSSVRLN
jgi:hypothetical protein